MKAQSRLLIAGSTLSQLGNWVSVTAVMIALQQQHGAAAVAVYFLARSVAAYFLSRPLAIMVPGRFVGRAWASSQAALALIMFSLVFWHQSTPLLIGLLAVAGVLQSTSASWLMPIAEATNPSDRKPLITAISTGISLAIVAGPAVGGILQGWGGLSPVFAFDAATFAVSLALVPWRLLPTSHVSEALPRKTRSTVLSSVLPLPPRIDAKIGALSGTWITFGLFGGLLTAIEMPVFVTMKGFGPEQIGGAISAYGLGGLVVFAASTLFGYSNRHLSISVIALGGVIGWILGDSWFLYIAFFITGLGFALVNSTARVAFSDVFAQAAVQSSEAWAWVNQLSLFTSIVSYLTAAIFFLLDGDLGVIAGLVIILGIVCLAFGARWDLTSRLPKTSP